MLRLDWTFTYKAGVVAEAAKGRAEYHEGRRDWWQAEHDETEAELRETGVEFRDRDVTGGKRMEVVLDPEKANRLNECRSKVDQHERQRVEYHAFARVLAENAEDDLDLTVDDVTWFYLA